MSEDPKTRSWWDTGLVPLGMVALGYVTFCLPPGGGFLVIAGVVVAICILIGDKQERQPPSRAALASLALALAFPLWIYALVKPV